MAEETVYQGIKAVDSTMVVGKRVSVSEVFETLDPHQTPLLNLLGFSEPVYNTHHTWYEDSMFAMRAVVAEDVDTAATEIKFESVDDLRPDHVLMINDEYILVESVQLGEKTAKVQRGFADTSPVEIKKEDVVEILFLRGEEGADAVKSRTKTRVPVTNITQIFTDSVSVTETQLQVQNYNFTDFYARELMKVIKLLGVQLDKALLNGVKYDAEGTQRLMQGLRSFIKTNVIDGGGDTLKQETMADAVQLVMDAGGFEGGVSGYVFMVGANIKRTISQFDRDIIREPQANEKRGTVVNYITTDFGEFPVYLNVNMPKGEVLFFDKERAYVRPLGNRTFTHEFLGRVGDFTKGQVVGEYTLEFHQEKAHARIRNVK